jgi:hypothetical protein
MPTYMITGPDGKKYRVSGQGSPEAALGALKKQLGAAQPTAPASNMPKVGNSFSAATEGLQSGVMFGFDDEFAGLMLSPIEATKNWWQGKGFDLSKAYGDVQRDFDARKGQRRQDFPVSSIAGEVVGGLATAGGAAKAGLTTIGRMGPVTGAALEGGAYGALSGAGEAKPGERLQGAAVGGATGMALGGILGGVSKGLSNRAAQKAANQTRMATPAMSADDLQAEVSVLYDQLRQSGARLPKSEAQRAKANIDIFLAQTDEGLAPTAFSLRKVIEKKFANGDVDVVDWHNLSKQVNLISRDANMGKEDARVVGQIKKQIDRLRDSNIVGPKGAMDAWKKANELSLRKAKVEELSRMMDFADLDTGQYTQAELSQTIAKRFRELYRREVKDGSRLFNADELAVIRDIGQAKTQSAIMNGLKKLAPRGVVSAALGAGVLGSMVPGGHFVVPAIGEAALRMSNNAASKTAQTFVDDVSRGVLPTLLPKPSRLQPLIPGISGTAGGLTQRR